jgi:hypothetical protein
MGQGRTFDRNFLVIRPARRKARGDDANPGNQREYENQPYHAAACSNDCLKTSARRSHPRACEGLAEAPQTGEENDASMP